MTADQLIDVVLASGGSMRAVGDRLSVRMPKGKMTADIRNAMFERKGELLSILSKKQIWIFKTVSGGTFGKRMDGQETIFWPVKIGKSGAR